MNIPLKSPRAVLLAVALAVAPACASNAETSPRKDALLASAARGCGAAPAAPPAPSPPVVGMCR
jgi:hypothetical protein